MSSAKITLYGMYSYLMGTTGTNIFEGFSNLPEGIDVDTLTDTILTEGGEFEPISSDPELLKGMISLFVSRHNRTFTKWMEALAIDYNPLENYDRQETWSDSGSGTTSNSGQTSNTNSTTSQSSGTTTGSGTNTNEVSAYDSTGYSPHHKDTSSTSSTTGASGSGSSTASGTSSESSTSSNSSRHDGRIHGNIGVTTSQQMLQSELDIARFNVYDEITNLFIDELLLAVYV